MPRPTNCTQCGAVLDDSYKGCGRRRPFSICMTCMDTDRGLIWLSGFDYVCDQCGCATCDLKLMTNALWYCAACSKAVDDEWRARAPKWQAEAPNAPGFYWARRDEDGSITVAYVTPADPRNNNLSSLYVLVGSDLFWSAVSLREYQFWSVAMTPPPPPATSTPVPAPPSPREP